MKIIIPLLLLSSFAPLAYGQGPISAGSSQVREVGVGFSYTQANVPSEGQIGINGVQAVFSADLNRHFALRRTLAIRAPSMLFIRGMARADDLHGGTVF